MFAIVDQQGKPPALRSMKQWYFSGHFFNPRLFGANVRWWPFKYAHREKWRLCQNGWLFLGGPKGKNFLRVFFGFVLFYEVPPLRRSQTPKNADKERPYTLLFCANWATQICAKYLKCVKIDTRGFSTKFACFFTQILHFLNFPENFSSFFPIPP